MAHSYSVCAMANILLETRRPSARGYVEDIFIRDVIVDRVESAYEGLRVVFVRRESVEPGVVPRLYAERIVCTASRRRMGIQERVRGRKGVWVDKWVVLLPSVETRAVYLVDRCRRKQCDVGVSRTQGETQFREAIAAIHISTM